MLAVIRRQAAALLLAQQRRVEVDRPPHLEEVPLTR